MNMLRISGLLLSNNLCPEIVWVSFLFFLFHCVFNVHLNCVESEYAPLRSIESRTTYDTRCQCPWYRSLISIFSCVHPRTRLRALLSPFSSVTGPPKALLKRCKVLGMWTTGSLYFTLVSGKFGYLIQSDSWKHCTTPPKSKHCTLWESYEIHELSRNGLQTDSTETVKPASRRSTDGDEYRWTLRSKEHYGVYARSLMTDWLAPHGSPLVRLWCWLEAGRCSIN